MKVMPTAMIAHLIAIVVVPFSMHNLDAGGTYQLYLGALIGFSSAPSDPQHITENRLRDNLPVLATYSGSSVGAAIGSSTSHRRLSAKQIIGTAFGKLQGLAKPETTIQLAKNRHFTHRRVQAFLADRRIMQLVGVD